MRIRIAALLLAISLPAAAQQHDPSQHAMHHTPQAAALTQGGQSAFAAIAEIVKVLEADPATDWSKVNIDALRAHLIDMDEVTLRANVRSRRITGGVEMDVTGGGRTAASIRRMVPAHAQQLAEHGLVAEATPIADGVRFRVTAKAGDEATVTKLRALGFAGIMAMGDHHTVHHLAIARGMGAHGH